MGEVQSSCCAGFALNEDIEKDFLNEEDDDYNLFDALNAARGSVMINEEIS